MDRRKLGGYLQGEAITSFYPTICLEECKSNYVSTLVQFVIPLHRFLEEVSYGDLKASNNKISTNPFEWNYIPILSDTMNLTYFTSIQMSGSLLVNIF